MPRDYAVFRAELRHAEAMGQVHAAAWHAAYAGIIPQSYLARVTPAGRQRLFLNGLERKTADYYLLEVEGTPAGLLILAAPRDEDLPPYTMEVSALYLLPQYYGQGYGQRLMDFAVEQARRAGCKTLSLWVLRQNRRARHFYRRYGFMHDGATQLLTHLHRDLQELRYRLEL